ncbi:hypothetical protein [Georgenia sp. SYP-B2076]|uniref:hypothetical protein n=1 Tax=Georgenia sp. SYP-B2076 TaxID=2495881 RepID=UPI003513847E
MVPEGREVLPDAFEQHRCRQPPVLARKVGAEDRDDRAGVLGARSRDQAGLASESR